jgi:hypothetical protein
LGHRHELDRADPHFNQVVENGDGAVERALCGESSDVYLGYHVLPKRTGSMRGIVPVVRSQVDHLGGTVDSLGLRARGGVGKGALAIEQIDVTRPDPAVRNDRAEISPVLFGQLHDAIAPE